MFLAVDNDGVIEEHLDTLFKVVHVGTFNTSVQVYAHYALSRL